MNSSRKATPDFLLLFLTLALVAFGLLMVFSASSMVSAYHKLGDSLYYVKRQAISAGIGFAGMLFFMNFSYHKLRKWTFPFFIAVIGALMLVLVIGNGDTEFGARSWIDLGPMNLQPSEFAKLAVILYLAALISNRGERLQDFKQGLLPCLIIVGIVAFLILLQPDVGSCAILVLGAMIVILVGGANLKHMAGLAGLGAIGAALYLTIPMLLHPDKSSYKIKRITTMFDPWSDKSDSGYQLVNSLYAFGHGGLTGTGLGKSVQKLHFLTQSYSDFIFAIIGEELGFIGSALFLLIYALFIWRGIVVSLRCPDTFASLVGVGIMGMLAVQTLINVGGVTNTIPMTGVTLPLISYGGSSIMATMISMGIVLNISRDQMKIMPEENKQNK